VFDRRAPESGLLAQPDRQVSPINKTTAEIVRQACIFVSWITRNEGGSLAMIPICGNPICAEQDISTL
jgi:hypothetical protein